MAQFFNINNQQQDEIQINDLTDKLFHIEIKNEDKIKGSDLTGELYNVIYNNLLNNLKNNIEDENTEYYCISKFVQYSCDESNQPIKIDNFADLYFVKTDKYKPTKS